MVGLSKLPTLVINHKDYQMNLTLRALSAPLVSSSGWLGRKVAPATAEWWACLSWVTKRRLSRSQRARWPPGPPAAMMGGPSGAAASTKDVSVHMRVKETECVEGCGWQDTLLRYISQSTPR